MGKKYCLSCASCGSSIYLALKSSGVKPGDKVALQCLYPGTGFQGPLKTQAPKSSWWILQTTIPSILTILIRKPRLLKCAGCCSPHMRGHIANMDRIMEICNTRGLTPHRRLRPYHGGVLGPKEIGQFWQGRLFLHPDLQAHEFR